ALVCDQEHALPVPPFRVELKLGGSEPASRRLLGGNSHVLSLPVLEPGGDVRLGVAEDRDMAPVRIVAEESNEVFRAAHSPPERDVPELRFAVERLVVEPGVEVRREMEVEHGPLRLDVPPRREQV